LAPSNQQLLKELTARAERASRQGHPPPEFVTRFVSFANRVPPAYNWLYPNHLQRNQPCMGIQQFTPDTSVLSEP
jgi:hypothetical protein